MAQELKAEWGRSLPGDLLKRWPRNADGELVPPALLTKCTGIDMDDVLLVNMLEAYGIPCLKNYPGDGQFGKIMLGMSGYGVEILVPETLLADAQALREGLRFGADGRRRRCVITWKNTSVGSTVPRSPMRSGKSSMPSAMIKRDREPLFRPARVRHGRPAR